jgi:hypothetical protein
MQNFMKKGILPIARPVKLYCENPIYDEVKKMKELKGWPFEPLVGVIPLGGGPGAGGGHPG